MTQQAVFSKELEQWLKSRGDKTLAGLIAVFEERSFAISWLLLMALPALPIPTLGISHVTELITALLCLELIVGRRTIWLPRRWLGVDVGKFMGGKAGTRLIGIIKWFERFSRHRGAGLLEQRWMLALLGLIVLVFTVAAFVAPPGAGLDTLPALGVVIISLAIILGDIVLLPAAILIGIGGIVLEITAGAALYKGLTHFF